MHEWKKAARVAFPKTIPVLVGYFFMGIACGILLSSYGYPFWWSFIMAAVIYAGSCQFVTVSLIASGAGAISAFFMALVLNLRHAFYGLSMFEKFDETGKLRPYMIFSLTDETYSLLCAAEVPKGVSHKYYYFFIALFDQCYWVLGCTVGGIAGTLFRFDTTGIDFVMTALFVVILVEQWQASRSHLPAVCGAAVSVLCLLVFGADRFILPALVLIVVLLMAFRGRIERGESGETER